MVHRPMEHILGFTRSHWMPPLVKCLRRIAPAAAMVDEFIAKHKIDRYCDVLPIVEYNLLKRMTDRL